MLYSPFSRALLLGSILLAVLPSGLLAQVPVKPTISRIQSGTMKTDLGYGIAMNKESTLAREAITIHDPHLPLAIDENVPVTVSFNSGRSVFNYGASYSITPTEPLSAIEVRFIIFDVFGDRLRVLSGTDVVDMPAGVAKPFNNSWNVLSENEASEFYASIAFIARVRTQSGRVVNADIAPVLAEASKFSKKFTAADVEPKPSHEKP